MRRSFIIFAILAAMAMPASLLGTGQDTRRDPPAGFTGDGCSWFHDGDYADCCFAHDKEYYRGGTKAERRAADDRLYQCVYGKGHKYLSKMMWMGVRLGGGAFLPTSFRWGFGQPKK